VPQLPNLSNAKLVALHMFLGSTQGCTIHTAKRGMSQEPSSAKDDWGSSHQNLCHMWFEIFMKNEMHACEEELTQYRVEPFRTFNILSFILVL
jgi:hypothetical protein